MKQLVVKFFKSEDGAITVDWVVLTAAAMALALLVLGIIQTGSVTTITQMWSNVDTEISNIK